VETVVIGIGNPVLSDDGVGIQVVRELAGRLRGRDDIATTEFYSGGIRLMEAMASYRRAVLIDSIITEGGRPGAVYRLELAALPETRHTHSTHDSNLAVAMEFGRMAGLRLPEKVEIWAVEAGDVVTVGEDLTPPVRQAVSRVVESVLEELNKPRSGGA
jgi:hydrogenase maturation protease